MTRRLPLVPLLATTAVFACTLLLPSAASAEDVAPSASTPQAPVLGPYADQGLSGLHAPVATGPTGRSMK